MDGAISARIDAHAGVLYARHADARTVAFGRVLAACEDYMRDTKAGAAAMRGKGVVWSDTEQRAQDCQRMLVQDHASIWGAAASVSIAAGVWVLLVFGCAIRGSHTLKICPNSVTSALPS